MLQELIVLYGLYNLDFYSSFVNFLLMSFYFMYLMVDWYLISIMDSDDFNSTDMNIDEDMYKTYPYADYELAYKKSLISSFGYVNGMYFLTKKLFVMVDDMIKNSQNVKYVYCNLDYIIKITYEDLCNLRVLKLAYSKIRTFIMVRSIKYVMSNPKIIMTVRNMMKNVTQNSKERVVNVNTTLLSEQNRKDRVVNVNTTLLSEQKTK